MAGLAYRLGKLAYVCLGTGCTFHCFTSYGMVIANCSGRSMEPFIHHGDVFLMEAPSVYTHRLKVGDVVAAVSPLDPNQYICKRVVAMYPDSMFDSNTNKYRRIPEGFVWLEGDNKEKSMDSRIYGPIPYGLINYRLFYKLWSGKGS